MEAGVGQFDGLYIPLQLLSNIIHPRLFSQGILVLLTLRDLSTNQTSQSKYLCRSWSWSSPVDTPYVSDLPTTYKERPGGSQGTGPSPHIWRAYQQALFQD